MNAGLRLRLFAIVLAAALLAIAPLAIVLLLQVRDALYARRVADVRARLTVAVRAAAECTDAACVDRVARAAGGTVTASCPERSVRRGEELVLCEKPIELHEDLAPVREQLGALDARLLLTLILFGAVLVVVAVSLLERGLVRRLGLIDTALEAVGAEQGGPQLLPEGGDAVGRVGAAVNRLAQRLREERARTRAQIEALENANRQIREAREEVERSERLASVGRLAAGVAHEVGNPVTALIAYSAMMRERLQQGKDVKEYAERVEREAARIDRILRDLLELARPSPAALQPIELARTIDLARAAVEQHGLAFETALPALLPKVRGEEHYAVQVLVNLFTNAARAGAKRVRISARHENGAVVVDVEDDGKGIAPEVLPRLFEPFVTTAAPGAGTGLGLALCHATMERIGGSISARNNPGRGATFELRFTAA
jgi:signal transduction histidine kinase